MIVEGFHRQVRLPDGRIVQSRDLQPVHRRGPIGTVPADESASTYTAAALLHLAYEVDAAKESLRQQFGD